MVEENYLRPKRLRKTQKFCGCTIASHSFPKATEKSFFFFFVPLQLKSKEEIQERTKSTYRLLGLNNCPC